MSLRPLRTDLNKNSLKIIGIPSEFIPKTLNDFKVFGDPAFKDLVSDYMSTIDQNFVENVGLFISGSNGQGKTFATSLILKEAYRHRYSCRRATLQHYINFYHKTWSRDDTGEYQDYFERNFMLPEFMVIDEVGKETETKYSNSIFEDLLRVREEKELPTILCTNYSATDFQNRYDSSITSLVRGNTIPIKAVGKDNRLDRSKLS